MRRYGAVGGASTMAFMALTSTQLLHAFSSRSDYSVIERTLPGKPGVSVAGGFAVQGLAALVPGLRQLLGLMPVSAADIAVSWGLAGVSFAVGEAIQMLAHLGHGPRGTVRVRGSIDEARFHFQLGIGDRRPP
jgi:Ca2+-transporting ATPase